MTALGDLKSFILYNKQFGVQLLAVLLVLIISLLTVLHYQQQSTVNELRAELHLIRDARTDLAKGMMHIILDHNPDLPFDKTTGRVLMNQALGTFESRLEKGEMPGDPEFTRSFRTNLAGWRVSLAHIGTGPRTTMADVVNIRVLYQAADTYAAKSQAIALGRLNEISDHLALQFLTALGLSAFLLGAMFVFLHLTYKARMKSAAEIWHQQNYDTLTDLPNRRLFYDRLVDAIKKGEHANDHVALLVLDLDRFKEINETLDHRIGDHVLKEVVERVQALLPEDAILSRIGGDKFAAVFHPNSTKELESLCDRLLQRFNDPYIHKNMQFYCTASMGLSIYPEDSLLPDDILKNAEQAMYVAKQEGRNRVRYFAPSMQEKAQRHLKLAADLRVAIQSDQLEIYYQPIIDLVTNKPTKVEALLRWKHPELGDISPVEFIPMAEDIGLIHRLGDIVFDQASENIARWQKAYGSHLKVSINKSPIQFRSEVDNHVQWLEKLERLKLPPGSIVLEITEGLLLDADPQIASKLERFRSAGLHVAIDDFGTGYSALSYIKKFHIDYLKIDRSFTQNLKPDSSDKALCEAIIIMARKLNIRVIAEGVETAAQHNILKEMSCDFGQGYYFARPMPEDAFEKYLAQHYLRVHEPSDF